MLSLPQRQQVAETYRVLLSLDLLLLLLHLLSLILQR